MKRLRFLQVPGMLFVRLSLIFFAGLVAAQLLSFWLTMYERDEATTNLMVGYIGQEVTSSVALLDRLSPAERPAWLPRLARRSYRFILGPGTSGAPPDAALSEAIGASIAKDIGSRSALTATPGPGASAPLAAHLKRSDGS